jgi:hypothetical protein
VGAVPDGPDLRADRGFDPRISRADVPSGLNRITSSTRAATERRLRDRHTDLVRSGRSRGPFDDIVTAAAD